MRKKISEIEAGDAVDLHKDRHADPAGLDPTFPFEYAEVVAVDPEVDGWIRVHFEGFPAVSFPADHDVDVNVLDDAPGAPGPR
jgi:hypothetical protein